MQLSLTEFGSSYIAESTSLSSSSIQNDGFSQTSVDKNLITSNLHGHQFSSVYSIKHLGEFCESCGYFVRSTTLKIYLCQHCHIICHSIICLKKLTRRCPYLHFLAKTNDQINHDLSDKNRYNETNKSVFGSSKYDAIHYKYRLAFKSLNLTDLSFFTANLKDQHWVCSECHGFVDPLFNLFNSYENKSTGFNFCNSYLKMGSELLISTIYDTELSKSEDLSIPQLWFQVPSLAHYLNESKKCDVKHVNSDLRLSNVGSFISKDDHLGPIQTWSDISVMQAINKMRYCNRISVNELVDKPQTKFLSLLDIETKNYGQARLCYYTGLFFCSKCHWGDKIQIPSCIFVLGDYKPKPVGFRFYF